MAKRRLSIPPEDGILDRLLTPSNTDDEEDLCLGVVASGGGKNFFELFSSSVFGEYSEGEEAADICRR